MFYGIWYFRVIILVRFLRAEFYSIREGMWRSFDPGHALKYAHCFEALVRRGFGSEITSGGASRLKRWTTVRF